MAISQPKNTKTSPKDLNAVASGKRRGFKDFLLSPWGILAVAALVVVVVAAAATSSYWLGSSNALSLYSSKECETMQVTVGRYRRPTHACVYTLQHILKVNSSIVTKCKTAGLDDDGVFGPQTESAVKCFQRTNFGSGMGAIEDDGVAGPVTFSKLSKQCVYNNYYNGSPAIGWCGKGSPYLK